MLKLYQNGNQMKMKMILFFQKKLKKKNVNKKDVKKLLSIVRNNDTKYEILFKKIYKKIYVNV